MASSHFARHFSAQMLKNVFMMQRMWFSLSLLLLLPGLVNFFYLYYVPNTSSNGVRSIEIPTFGRCKALGASCESKSPKYPSDDCISLVFYPNTTHYSSIMKAVADRHGLIMDQDIVGFADSESISKAIYPYMDIQSRHVVAAVEFKDVLKGKRPVLDYNIWVNSTYENCMVDLGVTSPMKWSIQNAIAETVINMNSEGKSSVDVHLKQYPGYFVSAADTGSNYQYMIIFAIGLVESLFLTNWMVDEKKNGLIDFLRSLGTSEISRILSYSVSFILINLSMSVVHVVSGYLLGDGFIQHTPILISIINDFLFFSGFSGISIICGSMLRRLRLAAFIYLYFTIQILFAAVLNWPVFFISIMPYEFDLTFLGQVGLSPFYALKRTLLFAEHYMGMNSDGYLHWSDLVDKSMSHPMIYGLIFYIGSYALFLGVSRLVSNGTSNGSKKVQNSFNDDRNLSSENKSILFSNTTKVFRDVTAVKELHMEVLPNQIFSLLGPNGSGKTTAVSLLCSIQQPKFGDIFVEGVSVVRSGRRILDSLGLCNQNDYYWAKFTPRNMFQIVGMVKGYSSKEIEEEMTRILTQLKLNGVYDKPIDTFSGGMKRKLSVALSLWKRTHIIILDEPTSGMDPVSRKHVWDFLREEKKSKTILLTTHSMEEADILSDRIAIMYLGRLRAIGSSLSLKHKFGRGYSIDVILQPNCDADSIVEELRGSAMLSDVISHSASQISIGVAINDLMHLPYFLNMLNQNPSVKEWLIKPSSLDEVFQRIVDINAAVDDVDKNDGKEVTNKHLCEICHQRPVELVTVYNRSGQAFQISGSLCKQCVSPPPSPKVRPVMEPNNGKNVMENEQPSQGTVQLALVGTTTSVSPPKTLEAPDSYPDSSSTPLKSRIIDIQKPNNVSTLSISLTLSRLWGKLILKSCGQISILIIMSALISLIGYYVNRFFEPYKVCDDGSRVRPVRSCIVDPIDIQGSYHSPSYIKFDEGGVFYRYAYYSPHTTNETYPSPLRVAMTESSKSLAESLEWPSDLLYKRPIDKYIQFDAVHDLNKYQLEKQKELDNLREMQSLWYPYYYIDKKMKPWEAYIELSSYIPQILFELSGSVNELKSDQDNGRVSATVGLYQMSTSLRSLCISYDDYQSICSSTSSWIDAAAALSTVHTAVSNTVTKDKTQFLVSIISMESKLFRDDQLDIMFLIGTIVMLVMMACVVFMMSSRIVVDLEMERVQMLMFHQVKPLTYVLSLVLSFSLLELLIVFCLGACLYLADLVSILQCLSLVASMILPSICSISFMIVLVMLLRSKIWTPLVYYVITLFMTSWLENKRSFDWTMAWNPPYIICKSIQSILLPSALSNSHIIITQLLSIVLIIVYSLLAFGICSTIVVRGSIKHFFKHVKNMLPEKSSNARREPKFGSPIREELLDHNASPSQIISIAADSDVKDAEYQSEQAMKYSTSSSHKGVSLVVHNIYKSFSEKKQVLNGVSFTVNDYEVFGLLGPNGAGKTTLINIIINQLKATYGDIRVFGRSLSDSGGYMGHVGIVPQFDVFYDELSVRDHLQLMCSLHGVRSNSRDVVVDVAKRIELHKDSFDMKTGTLSGGQKRRMVLGMALVGKPHLLLLDEPTTGLDPDSRSRVWRIIKDLQKEVTIVMTTHSMEEANALCSRIAILTNDGLQCIGPQTHLINKYGKGMTISISINREVVKMDPVEFVLSNISNDLSVVEKGSMDTYVFSIQQSSTVSISQIIERVITAIRKEQILRWSMNPSTLGEVFVRLCEKEDEF